MGMRFRTAALLLAIALPVGACGRQANPEPRVAHGTAAAAAGDTVVVYKSPTCGCCKAWVDYMREHGYTVVTHDTTDLEPIKRRLGVPAGRVSCHTATVRGYTIEGHVPADLIRKLIDEKSRFAGLAVAGMPMGSPGMEGIVKQEYDVLAFDREGRVEVYARR
jgi:hypothetical protein